MDVLVAFILGLIVGALLASAGAAMAITFLH